MNAVPASIPMDASPALQECLAAEHAAVFAYGVLGGVLSGTAAPSETTADADASYAAHRKRRDDLSDRLNRLGEEPVSAEPSYRPPFRVATEADCVRLARQVEERTAAVYAYAVAGTTGDSRAFVIDALTDCALRAVAWGAPLQAFPGVTEA